MDKDQLDHFSAPRSLVDGGRGVHVGPKENKINNEYMTAGRTSALCEAAVETEDKSTLEWDLR